MISNISKGTIFLLSSDAISIVASAKARAANEYKTVVILIEKCPVGSYLFTGSLLQYAYKFNPLILLGSRYSIESGEIQRQNSGE